MSNHQPYTNNDFFDYTTTIINTSCLNDAFNIFEKHVFKLGFEGVLYTFIPRLCLDSGMQTVPNYKVSDSYSPSYLSHYMNAHLDRNDPIIKRIKNGVMSTLDWHQEIKKGYMDKEQERVILIAQRDYGITNGLTIPTMSDPTGIAGASFISSESRLYTKLKAENLHSLHNITRLFHNVVISDTNFKKDFILPIINFLTYKERQFLAGLAQGSSMTCLAKNLNTTEKYLDKIHSKIKRKFWPSHPDLPPKINRNQLLYYVGLLSLLSYL